MTESLKNMPNKYDSTLARKILEVQASLVSWPCHHTAPQISSSHQLPPTEAERNALSLTLVKRHRRALKYKIYTASLVKYWSAGESSASSAPLEFAECGTCDVT